MMEVFRVVTLVAAVLGLGWNMTHPGHLPWTLVMGWCCGYVLGDSLSRWASPRTPWTPWVACSRRMPDAGGKYLVRCPAGLGRHSVVTAWYRPDTGLWYSPPASLTPTVTHWAPIPELP